MGRNGNKKAFFYQMAEYINSHVGQTVPRAGLVLGRETGINTATMYLYWLTQTGYIEPVGGFVKDETVQFRIIKPVPEFYGTMDLMRELRQARGKIS